MRTIRRQSRKEISPEVINEVKTKVNDCKVLTLEEDRDNLPSNSKYEEKIKELQKQVLEASIGHKALNKNEEKLLSAIKSEVINQDTSKPIIGRNMLIKKYKINNKYIDDSIKGLKSRKLVKRTKVPYTANITTYSWEIL